MGCACSAPADDFDDALEPEAFTGPSRTMLARPKPRVLAVIAAWHAADDPESASAIPRTRSKTRPGPLEEVAGKPMVFHAWHAAQAAKCVTRCVVATDDDAVETTALAFGARVVRVDDTKTSSSTKNENRFFGSVAGAAHALAASNAAAFDVVAVVDADEAFVEAHHIELVADAVINAEAQSATCTRDVMDAADARNDAGRNFVRADYGASAASGYATVASVFKAPGTDADRLGALADDASGSLSLSLFEQDADDTNGSSDGLSPTASSDSDSPTSPTSPRRTREEREARSVAKNFRSTSSAETASPKSPERAPRTMSNVETSTFVGVEVGVRSYLTSALLEIIDGAPPRTNQKPFDSSERSAPKRRGFRNESDLLRNDPTREALRLGWRVAAVRAEARNRLGGLKTQRSLDARNAEIAAGEIRFVPLF